MDKPQKTPADYIVVALSPLLIMLLVGSLAFFLIQVFYRGAMVHGIRWLMFWFVLAIVLVSRIGIEQGKGHARSYGVVLGGVTWFYLAHTHGTIVLGALLLAITWWCAHQLTVDCTLINEDEDASGEGVLQGLWRMLESAMDQPATPPPKLPPLSPLEAQVAANLARRHGRKPARAPGRTVVWFSLAALPLFGLGQLLLPTDDPHARRIGFTFLAVYLAAALSLLATTSFLGLRRYLRQRSTEMPVNVTFAWMRFAAFLLAGVLLVALILPRPGANSTWKELTYQIKPKPHKASDYALPFNPPGEGDGTPSDQPSDQVKIGVDSRRPVSSNGGNSPRKHDQAQPNPRSQNDRPESSNGGAGPGGKEGASGNQGNEGRPGDNSSAQENDGNSTQSPRSIRVKDTTGSGGGDDSGGEGMPNGGADNGSEQARDGKGGRPTVEKASDERRPSNQPQTKPKPKEQKQIAQKEQPPEHEKPEKPPASERRPSDLLARLLRWLVIVAVAGLLIWFAVRYRKVIADMIRSFLKAVREFLRRLLAIRWRREPKTDEAAPPPVPILEPFASYENPFVTGKDKTWSPDRLLCYTYEAVCSWAKEHGISLRPQETPREFLRRLEERFPEVWEDLDQFAFYYTYLAFAKRLPEDFETESIRRLWHFLGDSIPMGAPRSRAMASSRAL